MSPTRDLSAAEVKQVPIERGKRDHAIVQLFQLILLAEPLNASPPAVISVICCSSLSFICLYSRRVKSVDV
jgi:hypothetical protein